MVSPFLVQASFIPSRLDWRTFLSVLATHCAIQVNDLLTFGSSNISIFLPKLITIVLIIWPLLSFSGSRAGSKWQWHWPISSGPKLHSRCPRSQVWSRNLLPLFNLSNNEQIDGPSLESAITTFLWILRLDPVLHSLMLPKLQRDPFFSLYS